MSKVSKTTLEFPFNRLEVCPSLLPFVFAVSFIPSSNFRSGYFNVLLNLVIFPTVKMLIKFVAQLLENEAKCEAF